MHLTENNHIFGLIVWLYFVFSNPSNETQVHPSTYQQLGNNVSTAAQTTLQASPASWEMWSLQCVLVLPWGLITDIRAWNISKQSQLGEILTRGLDHLNHKLNTEALAQNADLTKWKEPE